jgi:hypothetical protein
MVNDGPVQVISTSPMGDRVGSEHWTWPIGCCWWRPTGARTSRCASSGRCSGYRTPPRTEPWTASVRCSRWPRCAGDPETRSSPSSTAPRFPPATTGCPPRRKTTDTGRPSRPGRRRLPRQPRRHHPVPQARRRQPATRLEETPQRRAPPIRARIEHTLASVTFSRSWHFSATDGAAPMDRDQRLSRSTVVVT